MTPFGPGVFGDPGVHSGNSASVILADSPGPGRATIRQGRDVQPFLLAEPRLFLRLDVAPTPEHYFRVGTLERYVTCPIVLRQTANRPIAALHARPTYFRNSVLAGFGLNDLSPGALVALLNSELFAWFHRYRNRDARQLRFPQVKVGHLRALPRPPSGERSRECFRALEERTREIEELSQSLWLARDRSRLPPRTFDPPATRLAALFEADRADVAPILQRRAELYAALNLVVAHLYGVEPSQAEEIHCEVRAARHPPARSRE